MAIVSITGTKLSFNSAEAMPATVAVDATSGCKVDFTATEDAKILIVLQNAAAAVKTATVKAGGGIQGVDDLSVSIPASSQMVITVESGKYMQTSGDDKGCVVITGTDANVMVAAIELP